MVEISISRQGKGTFPASLEEAAVGDEIIYHVGKYASGPHKDDALQAALNGKCFIFQRRLGQELFSYVAVKASAKHEKKMRGLMK
tara:strand:+ start:6031 stop:6285 length:255 start_codon:yes stop_codon:yes gene_type:complete